MSRTAAPLPHHSRGRMALLGLLLLLLYVVVPRIHNFSASFTALKTTSPELVLVACVFVAGTYVCAAGMYQLLAFKHLHPGRTLKVQVASAFANRLLPAGLGGLTLNTLYLRRSRHSLPQALAVVSLNNVLGLVGHALLFIAVLAVQRGRLWHHFAAPSLPGGWWLVLALAVVAVNIVVFRAVRQYVLILSREVLGYIAAYRGRLHRLFMALGVSVLLTLGYVAAFEVCLRALHIGLNPWDGFVVFTMGVVVGTVTPTPGGLGGAEAGLVAGLVAYGVAASPALASVLLFRFLTYWLSLLPGFGMFVELERQYVKPGSGSR